MGPAIFADWILTRWHPCDQLQAAGSCCGARSAGWACLSWADWTDDWTDDWTADWMPDQVREENNLQRQLLHLGDTRLQHKHTDGMLHAYFQTFVDCLLPFMTIIIYYVAQCFQAQAGPEPHGSYAPCFFDPCCKAAKQTNHPLTARTE